MTIFYFTSTGNCLAVAKRIGGKNAALVSIPQIIAGKSIEYKDDVIGIVFPIYSWRMPKMCREFIDKTTLTAGYTFAIGTYGAMAGSCMQHTQRYAAERGFRIDYAESLLMVDNYLPGFDVTAEVAKLPKKDTEANLSRIVSDLDARKKRDAGSTIIERIFAFVVNAGKVEEKITGHAKSFIVNDKCNKCGTCAKVCPSGNIKVSDKVNFGGKCASCLGCVHLCPKNAIHLKNEKSAERWRNPEVSLAEIVKANNRG